MSRDLNKVQLTGRLAQDPDVNYTQQGTARVSFTLATNRSWKDGDGQIREEVQWTPIVAWDRLAEICAEYLRKGSRVYIEGRLQTRSWKDAESAEKQYKTEVVLSEMIMLDSKGEADEAEQPAPEPTPPPAPTSRRRTRVTAADVL
ncbi:MAG TPA: single-stranded DNA-binding protein [Herpetosiphonaceae bacterium]